MKKIAFALLLILTNLILAQSATIKIDIDRKISEINPKIYEVFMESIYFNGKRMGLPDSVEFNTLYGTLYDTNSPIQTRF